MGSVAVATRSKRAQGTTGPVAKSRAPSSSSRGAAAGVPLFLMRAPGEQVQAKCDACELEKRDAEREVVQKKCACGSTSCAGRCGDRDDDAKVSKKSDGGAVAPVGTHAVAARGVVRAGGALPHAERIQAAFGRHDVSGVRAQVGGDAEPASEEIGALAYTIGDRVGFRREPDVRLAAHEAAHVVQQRNGAKLAGGVGREGDAYERNADEVAERVARGESAEPLLDGIAGRGDDGGAVVQRKSGGVVGFVKGVGSAIGEGVSAVGSAIGEGVDAVGDALGEAAWGLLEEIAPGLVPIVRRIKSEGILGFLGSVIRDAIGTVFDGLGVDKAGPLALFDRFKAIAAEAGRVIKALLSGDCQPLLDALGSMKESIGAVLGDAWDAVTDFFRPVGDFFSKLWKDFGAPFADLVSSSLGAAWAWIKKLGEDIWAWTSPVRDAGGRLWNWLKESLFGSDQGSSGDQGGIVAWISDKAGAAWKAISDELAPVIEPVRSFAKSVAEALPLEQLASLRKGVSGWLETVKSTAGRMKNPDDVAKEQVSLRDELLPAVLGGIANVRDGITGFGESVQGSITAASGKAVEFIAAVRGNALLAPFAGAIDWVGDAIGSFATWATGTVGSLFGSVASGLDALADFIVPIAEGLSQMAEVVSDFVGSITGFITGIWQRIPACIREPLESFLRDEILARIPIFAQVMKVKNLWARLTGTIARILRQVFIDGDLLGAAWTYFSTLLEIVGLPPDLVLKLVANAAQAIGDIINDPLGFFVNVFEALKRGFVLFMGNFPTHILNALAKWLFGSLQEGGIKVPSEFSLGAVFDVVLQVLDLGWERILKRIELKYPALADKLRRGAEIVGEGVEIFKRVSTEGPGALWDIAAEKLSDLWGIISQSVISFVVEKVVTAGITKLVSSFLDPTGIMAVVNTVVAVYNAIESFVAYLREMLEIVNKVFEGLGQIARGETEPAAQAFDTAAAASLPVLIGFAANQVSLGKLPDRVKEIIGKVREKVDAAIDWVIEKVAKGIKGLVSGVKSVASAAMEALGIGVKFKDAKGEGHSIYTQGDGASVVLMVASAPQTLEARLAALPDAERRAEAQKLHADAAARTKKLNDEVSSASGKSVEVSKDERARRKAEQKAINTMLQTIAQTLSSAGGDEWTCEEKDLPDSVLQYAPRGAHRTVIAEPLTKKGGAGSQPSPGTFEDAWKVITARGEQSYWVRAHLVHGHTGRSQETLHGSGATEDNLVLTDKSLNAGMNAIEKRAIDEIHKPKDGRWSVLSYKVDVDSDDAYGFSFANSITVTLESLAWCAKTPGARRNPLTQVYLRKRSIPRDQTTGE